MDIQSVFNFALIAILLVISPGPNGVLIAKTVPTSGKAAGFANVFGFMVALYVLGAFSILGFSIILVQSAYVFLTIKILGALYLCWMGFNALKEAWRGIEIKNVAPAKRKRTLGIAFLEGFLTNVLNPKAAIFYLTAFPQFIPQDNTFWAAPLILVFVHTFFNFVWFSAMVILFSRLSNAAKNQKFQRWLKGITGAVFCGFGIKLALLKA